MSVIAETDPAALADTSRAFSRNRVLVRDEISEVFQRVDPAQIAAIHGKLIALGMLKFEIGSRADGVQYQVTPFGRQALLPPAERKLIPEWLLEAESPGITRVDRSEDGGVLLVS